MRQEGLAVMRLWEAASCASVQLYFFADSQPAIQILRNGSNPSMRYMGRTHRIDVAWLMERFKDANVHLVYVLSALQAADIFTKGFTDERKWKELLRLIAHYEPGEVLGPEDWADVGMHIVEQGSAVALPSTSCHGGGGGTPPQDLRGGLE